MHLIADGDVDLADSSTIGGAEELGLVKLAPSALTAGIAADTSAGTERAADERPTLGEEELELLVELALCLEQELTKTAWFVGHGRSRS